MKNILTTLMILSLMTTVVVILRLVLAHLRTKRETQAQLELHTRLIDRFSTSKELLDYLDSGAGARLLTRIPAEIGGPHRRILASTQAGIVLTFVGAAFLLLQGFDGVQESAHAVKFVGGVLLSLGLGFITSAVVAWVLSRSWGLLEARDTSAAAPR